MIATLARKAVLPLLIALAGVAAAQVITPPPMKMGLWQEDVTIQMSGMPNGMTMPPRSVTEQSCMTSDTWKDSLRSMQQSRRQGQMNCSTSSIQQDAHHVTFDASCTTQQGMSTTIHVDMQFDNDENMHGTTSATMTGPNVPPGMAMHSTIKSKYLGADCGTVKPGTTAPSAGSGGPPA
ncbi:MAG TPA: DUF3617 family protein [Acidobacteriaceae bacterium]|jgi:hypothetical protein|nr:DUF3617 family protein [Acidobacteriaceae bacterium]